MSKASQPPKILIVDDEPYNVEMLYESLQGFGYDLIRTFSGPEALAVIEENPPDLVLLDIMMPHMDGFEVCQRLRENPATTRVPVIVVTALDAVQDYVRAIELGADDFMIKPFNTAVLQARVKSYLRSKRLADEVEQLNHLRRDLTHMIVHDLNNPMSGILGYLDLVDMSLGEDSKTRERLELARRAAHEACRLIQNLMDIEKMESGTLRLQRESASLKDLVNQAIVVFQPSLLSDELEVKVEGEAHMLNCDVELIKRLFQNLLGNAIKFAPSSTAIEISWRVENGQVGLVITNHGPVIPAEFHQTMFDKFTQVATSHTAIRRGSGLGLAFCRLVTEAHGGTIGVRSPVPGWEDGVQIVVTIPEVVADA